MEMDGMHSTELAARIQASGTVINMQQATIKEQDALIKQLGEALADSRSYRNWDAMPTERYHKVIEAVAAYEAWKAG